MSKPSRRQILDEVARDHVSQDVNLLPGIAARISRKGLTHMNARNKLVWTALWVVIGLAVISTAAYALYNYFADPGLQAVQDAGLGTHPQVTAQPTLIPIPTPTPTQLPLDEWTQVKNGVTLRLDSISLSEMGTRLQFTVHGLADGQSLDLPQVDYIGAQPDQKRGASLRLVQQGDAQVGTFVSYQLLRQGVVNHQVDVDVSIPLLDVQGQTQADFDYHLKAVPVSQVQFNSQQTYSARYDGLELVLPEIIINPNAVRVRLCYPAVVESSSWRIASLSLAWLDETGQPAQSSQTDFTVDVGEGACRTLTLTGATRINGNVLQLAVTDLVDETGAPRTGQWVFSVDSPDLKDDRSLAPLAAETIANLTASLHWAYADASRAAFEVKFENWQPEYALGNILGTDDSGNPVGYGYGIQVNPDDASRLIILFTPDDPSFLQTDQVTMNLEIQVIAAPDYVTPLASFHFKMDLPVYPNLVLEPGQAVTANGIEIRLEKVTMSPSFSTVILCYQKPTRTGNSDWGIYNDATLQSGGYTVQLNQYVLLADVDYSIKDPNGLQLPEGMERCVEIGFPFGHRNQAAPAIFRLSIPSLQLSIPEVISDSEIAAANQKLAAEGLEFAYKTFSNSFGGGSGFDILKKPEGMDEQQALERLYWALGYKQPGPWEFDFTISQ